MKSTIMIAATGSGKGKTTFVTGFLKVVKENNDNLSVHAFKCGPDYIDPMFHRDVLQIPSTNLDAFFLEDDSLRNVFHDNSSDVNVIEAAMGLFDGIGATKRASAYETAATLGCRIILLVDGSGMGYSLIPMIKGYLLSDTKNLISGIVINRISEKFYKKIAPVIEEELGIKVLGYLPKIKGAELNSRHLGLLSPEESEFSEKLKLISDQIIKSVDVNEILEVGKSSECNEGSADQSYFNIQKLKGKKILVAKDEAFSFCYEENIKLLKRCGADVEYFSPLHDSKICDDIDAVILYGGYPENYAKELSDNISMIESIREASKKGVKIIAECGGFMYLLDSIIVEDKTYKMTGLIRGYSLKGEGLIRFGYVNILDKSSANSAKVIKAHEFHYFEAYEVEYSKEYSVINESSKNEYRGIVKTDNIFAGFPHLYYLSQPEFIVNLLV